MNASPIARSIGHVMLQAAAGSEFARDVVTGLTAEPKRIPPKYFYDAEGSRLFERITRLPEYYPTRSELRILEEHAGQIAAFVSERDALIEFGSGSTAKVRLLLACLPRLLAYVPVDISVEFLEEQAEHLRREYSHLTVMPIAADFTLPFELPPAIKSMYRAGFFPGSTIGNFEPAEAKTFLRNAAAVLGPGAAFIIGVDLVKDEDVLNGAYNDVQGVTAAFNLNLLARACRELGADFDLSSFAHEAFYNRDKHRIEMHLVSRKAQEVQVAGARIVFAAGETIHTENSYKYTVESFAALAEEAGWRPVHVWTDNDELFSVHALVAAGR